LGGGLGWNEEQETRAAASQKSLTGATHAQRLSRLFLPVSLPLHSRWLRNPQKS
jgi:hypothetical protein